MKTSKRIKRAAGRKAAAVLMCMAAAWLCAVSGFRNAEKTASPVCSAAGMVTAAAADKDTEVQKSEQKITNTSEMSVISISVTQSSLGENGLRQEKPSSNPLLPGTKLSLIPTITNEGADCYVRLKLDAVVKKDGEQTELPVPFSLSSLFGLSSNWKVIGEYIYRTESLANQEAADVFEGIQIDPLMDNSYAGCTMEIGIVAEAVQSAFFTPDFTAENPWNGVQTEPCVREGFTFVSLRVSEKGELSVSYEGGAEGFVIVPTDFFKHFEAMLPGGSYSGTITVNNTSESPVRLFFKTEILEEKELLEQLRLTIIQENDDRTEHLLYEGAYNSKSLQTYQMLGRFAPEEGCLLRFIISVPETLTNVHTLQTGKVNWYFAAEEDVPVTPEPETARTDEKQDIIETVIKAVKTADSAQIVRWLSVIGMCLAVFIQLVRSRKRRRKKK